MATRGQPVSRALVSIFAIAAAVVLAPSGAATVDFAAENARSGDFAGPVDIGGGRHLYLECRGTGGPTVILESGYHDSAMVWSLADAHQPPAFERIAAFTRVCAYDRPGTLLYNHPPAITDRSSPAPMPRSLADISEDLHALLAAAEVPVPYVFAAHSMGGLIARSYAQTYPEDVIGLVFVDAFPAEFPALFGAEWEAYRELLDNPLPQFAGDPRLERIDIGGGAAALASLPALKRMPIVVITKGEPFAVPPDAHPEGFTFANLERLWPIGAEALVRLEPGTPHVIATGSDHYIQVHDPDLVAELVRLVIGRTGDGG